MWTGVVSTARLTHATPAACYAHTPARGAEDDTDLAGISRSAAESGYPDIARQLFDFRVKPTTMNGHASPGLEVAMGGGRSKFLRITDADPEYPAQKGTRNDRDLAAAWAARGGAYVWNAKDFAAIDPAATGPVLGLFEPSHMQYELDRKRDPGGEPSLTEMTEKAIRILERVAEGILPDGRGRPHRPRHHEGNAARALNEAVELSRAVERAAAIAERRHADSRHGGPQPHALHGGLSRARQPDPRSRRHQRRGRASREGADDRHARPQVPTRR